MVIRYRYVKMLLIAIATLSIIGVVGTKLYMNKTPLEECNQYEVDHLLALGHLASLLEEGRDETREELMIRISSKIGRRSYADFISTKRDMSLWIGPYNKLDDVQLKRLKHVIPT